MTAGSLTRAAIQSARPRTADRLRHPNIGHDGGRNPGAGIARELGKARVSEQDPGRACSDDGRELARLNNWCRAAPQPRRCGEWQGRSRTSRRRCRQEWRSDRHGSRRPRSSASRSIDGGIVQLAIGPRIEGAGAVDFDGVRSANRAAADSNMRQTVTPENLTPSRLH